MPSLLFWLLLTAAITFFIWLLHKNQHRRARESAELNTPLPGLDQTAVPDYDMAAPVAATAAVPIATPVAAVAAPASDVPPDVASPSSDASPAEPVWLPVAAASAPAMPASAPAVSAAPGASTSASTDNWLLQARTLRERGNLDAALALCRAHYPRSQAFQQAAVILRQQIRDSVEQLHPAGHLLRELYRTAALADLFRGGSHWKPVDPQLALAQIRDTEFSYTSLGHQYLRLLNKGDVRALEQLWGHPAAHRHAEELLGEHWRALCARTPAPPAS